MAHMVLCWKYSLPTSHILLQNITQVRSWWILGPAGWNHASIHIRLTAFNFMDSRPHSCHTAPAAAFLPSGSLPRSCVRLYANSLGSQRQDVVPITGQDDCGDG